ncbi:hypothetical protein V6615_16405 (plasmid) [Oscillospiraceae bacterium PP1C4]
MREFFKKTIIPIVAASLITPSMIGITVNAAAPELEYTYFKSFSSNTAFTPPQTGKYRIICVGKSGDGGSGASGGYGNWNREQSGGSGGAGAGGNSGAIAVSDLTLSHDTTYAISLTDGIAKFGDSLYAESGANGGNGTSGSTGNTVYSNGLAGLPNTTRAKAVGGNVINEEGYLGGRGGGRIDGSILQPQIGENGGGKISATSPSGHKGGGGARYPAVAPVLKYLKQPEDFIPDGFCSGAGYGRPNVADYTSGQGPSHGGTGKSYLEWRNEAIVLTGGGGGGASGGGQSWDDAGSSPNLGSGSGGAGGKGQPAIVIIEKCVDQTAPVVNSVVFSQDAKNVIITSTDEVFGAGLYGIYINGELRTGSNIINYSIPNGVMSLKIYAEDYAGNVSPIQTEAVPDKIQPEIKTVVFSEDAKTATITATDEGNSGLKGIYVNGNLELTTGTLVYNIPDGVYNLALKAIDKAENQSEVVEKTVPDIISPTIGGISFSEDSKTATISLSDVGSSGVKGVYVNDVFKFAESGGTVSVHIPDEVYSLTLEAMDNAGNKSAIQTVTVPDVVPPTIDSCIFADGGISAVITASDKGSSKLKGIYVNGEFFSGGSVDYTLPKGIYTLALQAEDNAGNKSVIVTKDVPDNIPPKIESIGISTDGKTALIELSDTGGSGIKGATINGQFFSGGSVNYTIPEGTKYLIVQAEDHLGNKSETIKKRVPGWSEIIDTITIKPVEFRENNTIATIIAETSLPNTTIAGIYVNDVLYAANPVIYKVSDGMTTMQLQAVNNEGDKSVIYNLDVPAWGGGVRITSVSFSEQNDFTKKSMEALIKAVDDTGHNIHGIYVNDEFFEGDAITYTVLPGTRHLNIQAINTNGDTSEVIIKRVPGWSEIVDTLSIKSANFANGIATITAESTGAAVYGIYVNDKFYDGNPILYTVSSSTKTLKLQAENDDGDKSPVVYKEVSYADSAPVVDTLAVKSVDFSGAIAKITAESTSTDVSGIYINDKLFNGNPVLFPVTSSMKTIKAQAENAAGERSAVVYKEVPSANSSSSSSSSSKSSSGKSRISISAPEWTSAKKAKVKIRVSDSNGIDSVEAYTEYGEEQDITDQDYLYITKDTTVTVAVTNDDGKTTKKSADIECFDREAPTVTVSQSGNTLSIRATDKKSGVSTIHVNNKAYKQSSVKYSIPNGVMSVNVQAQDNAGNVSDPVDYKADKPVTAVPVAGTTTTTVTPTPTPPEPEPLPETPSEDKGSIFEKILSDKPEEQPEEQVQESEPKTAGMVGAIASAVLILGGGGAVLWYMLKKRNSVPVEGAIDDDFDFEYVEDNDEFEEPEVNNKDNVKDVVFKVS